MAMSKFGRAFAEARKRGDKTFEFNGKKYTTKTKEDEEKESKSRGMDMKEAINTAKRTRDISAAEGTMSDSDRERAQLDSAREQSQAGRYGTMKAGGTVKMKSGGMVKSSASKRADGCAKKGKTKGRMV